MNMNNKIISGYSNSRKLKVKLEDVIEIDEVYPQADDKGFKKNFLALILNNSRIIGVINIVNFSNNRMHSTIKVAEEDGKTQCWADEPCIELFPRGEIEYVPR